LISIELCVTWFSSSSVKAQFLMSTAFILARRYDVLKGIAALVCVRAFKSL
jgi:hypothetical protein